MQTTHEFTVEVRPWAQEDLAMLERIFTDPAIMRYLGEVETSDKVRARHERYLSGNKGMLHMFAILAGPDRRSAGLIGFWEHESEGHLMYETGWVVLPEFQGQGIATRASRLVAGLAREEGRFRYLHAYCALENEASNAVCRKAGFMLAGQVNYDITPGNSQPHNDWVIDLRA